MASARGDALDWALALARAPGERYAMRQQPLPDGMEVVLQIAGGSQATVIAEAAANAGMPPADAIESVSFYLREMLFVQDADPYRVLGLAADASDEQVKHHHRLLQQWLHPDRPASDWDAAFAARVNAAWSQLRTSARREAYAARVGIVSTAATSEPSWTQPTWIHAVAMPVEAIDAGVDEDRWRRRAPVLALFGVCAILGVLAVRDMQREPGTGLSDTEVAAVSAAEESPAVALQLPESVPAAKPVDNPAPPKRVAAAPAPRPAPTAAVVKPVAKPVAKQVIRPAAPPAAVAVASKPVPKPLPKPIAPPAARPRPAPPIAVAAAPKPKVVAPKPEATAVAPSQMRKPPVVVATATPKAGMATPKVATAAPKVAIATPRVAMALAPATQKPAVKPATKPAPVVVAKPPVAAVATVTKPVSKPPLKPAPAAPQPPGPKPAVAPAPAAVAAVATPAATVSPAPAPPAAASSPEQVAQAQQTGQRLLAYVSGRGGGMPPIWANLSSQTQASRAREALQGNGRVDVGAPNWRVGGSSATMQASLSPGSGEARRLRVDLVWREQRWLVTGLSLEQAP